MFKATEAATAIGVVAGVVAAALSVSWRLLVPMVESRATSRCWTSSMISENNKDAKSCSANALRCTSLSTNPDNRMSVTALLE